MNRTIALGATAAWEGRGLAARGAATAAGRLGRAAFIGRLGRAAFIGRLGRVETLAGGLRAGLAAAGSMLLGGGGALDGVAEGALGALISMRAVGSLDGRRGGSIARRG